MQFVYPAQFRRAAPDEIVVSFRDLPECLTSGDDIAEAWAEAMDALEETIAGRIDDGEPIPPPSKGQLGEYEVSLSAEMSAVANLYLAFRRGDFSAQALGIESEAIDRMLNSRSKLSVARITEIHDRIRSEFGVEVWEPAFADRTAAVAG